MIKDILVHVPTERPMQAVIDASISLAQDLVRSSMRLRSAIFRPAGLLSWTAARPRLSLSIWVPSRREPRSAARQRLPSLKPRPEMPAFHIVAARSRTFLRTRLPQPAPLQGSTISQSSCSRSSTDRRSITRFRQRSCSRPAVPSCSFHTFSVAPSGPNASEFAGMEAGLPPARSATPNHSWPRPMSCSRSPSMEPRAHRPMHPRDNWPNTWRAADCRSNSSIHRHRAPTSNRRYCLGLPTRTSTCWSWVPTAIHGCRKAFWVALPVRCCGR